MPVLVLVTAACPAPARAPSSPLSASPPAPAAVACRNASDCIQRGDQLRDRDPALAIRYYEVACATPSGEGCARAGNMYRVGPPRDLPRAILMLSRACRDSRTTPEYCSDLALAEDAALAEYAPSLPLPAPCTGVAATGKLTEAGLRWECGAIHVSAMLRVTDYYKPDLDGWAMSAWRDRYGSPPPGGHLADDARTWRDLREQRHAEWSTSAGGAQDRAWEWVHIAELHSGRNLEISIGGYETSSPPPELLARLRRAFVDVPLTR